MSNFTMIKGELSQISKEKDRIEENQELLQLDKLRATLGETIDESEKVGEDDLLQLDQTIGTEPSDETTLTQTSSNGEATTLIDTENIQLSEDEEIDTEDSVSNR